MKRLSNKKISEIRDLFHKGLSKHKIARLLNVSRATVIRHSGVKGSYNKPVKIFPIGYSEIDGEIVGIFAGDGSQYHEPRWGSYEVTIHIGKSNVEYLPYVKKLYEAHFNKKFWVCRDKVCFKLRTKSKAMFTYFSNYLFYNSALKHSTVRLKEINLPHSFKLGFLRGLWDTDGSISKSDSRVRVVFYTTSKALAEQIHKILIDMQIKNSVYANNREYRDEKTLYSVSILNSSVGRIEKFIKQGF